MMIKKSAAAKKKPKMMNVVALIFGGVDKTPMTNTIKTSMIITTTLVRLLTISGHPL
jgi:hypothetical protein